MCHCKNESGKCGVREQTINPGVIAEKEKKT
jgi:hypothetical protein